jgi:SAM-dependent methyltransferase
MVFDNWGKKAGGLLLAVAMVGFLYELGIFDHHDSVADIEKKMAKPEVANEDAEELQVYQIHRDERIAEVGAGDASFARELLKNNQQISLYLNDINTRAVKNIQWSLDHDPIFLNTTSHVSVIKGSLISTGLEGKKLNKIIIRDAFHHFDRKTAMLASIRQSLDKNGKLYLFERYKEECKNDCCPILLSREDIMKDMSDNGFFLSEEKPMLQNGQWHYVLGFEASPWSKIQGDASK